MIINLSSSPSSLLLIHHTWQELPIHVACKKGYEKIIKILLDRGGTQQLMEKASEITLFSFSSSIPSLSSYTMPTHTLTNSHQGHQGVRNFLTIIKLSSSLILIHHAWQRLLIHYACEKGYEKIIKILLDRGSPQQLMEKVSEINSCSFSSSLPFLFSSTVPTHSIIFNRIKMEYGISDYHQACYS